MPYAFPSYVGSGVIFIKNLNWLLSSSMIVAIRIIGEHVNKISDVFLWIFVIEFESFNFENIFNF